MKKEGGFSENK